MQIVLKLLFLFVFVVYIMCVIMIGSLLLITESLINNVYFFFRDAESVQLPPFGKYATGIFFLDKLHHQESEKKFAALAEELDMSVLAWRTVPTDNSTIGAVAKNSEPFMRQVKKIFRIKKFYVFIEELKI